MKFLQNISLLFILASLDINAKQWHVAPTSKQFIYNGKKYQSVDIQDALSQKFTRAGDTVWIHEGTYNRIVVVTLQGSKDAPILVSSFPGEKRPLFDVKAIDFDLRKYKIDNVKAEKVIFTIDASHVVFYGLETTNSDNNPFNRKEQSLRKKGEKKPRPVANVSAIKYNGTYCTITDFEIHDMVGQAIGWFKKGDNSKVVSNKMYHNGYSANTRASGDGFYAQNSELSTMRYIEGNLIFENFDWGTKLYGTDMAFLSNYTFDKNIYSNNHYLFNKRPYNVLLGGKTNLENVVFKNNHSYTKAAEDNSNSALRLGFTVNYTQKNVVLEKNYFMGQVSLLNSKDIKISNNLFYSKSIVSKTSAAKNIVIKNINVSGNGVCKNDDCYASEIVFENNNIILEGVDALEPIVTTYSSTENEKKAKISKYNFDGFNKKVSSKNSSKYGKFYSKSSDYRKDIEKIYIESEEVKGKKYMILYNWANNKSFNWNVDEIGSEGTVSIQHFKSRLEPKQVNTSQLNLELGIPKNEIKQAFSYTVSKDLCNEAPDSDPFFNVYEIRYFPHKASIIQTNNYCKDKFILAQISGIKDDAYITEYYLGNQLVTKVIGNEAVKIPLSGNPTELKAKVILRNNQYKEISLKLNKC